MSQVTLNLPLQNISTKVEICMTLVIPITKHAIIISPIATNLEDKFARNYNRLRYLIRTSGLQCYYCAKCTLFWIRDGVYWGVSERECLHIVSMSLLFEDQSSISQIGVGAYTYFGDSCCWNFCCHGGDFCFGQGHRSTSLGMLCMGELLLLACCFFLFPFVLVDR